MGPCSGPVFDSGGVCSMGQYMIDSWCVLGVHTKRPY